VDPPGLVYETASSFGGAREHAEHPRLPIELAANERALTVPGSGDKGLGRATET
jgi:hypothetical protein